MVRYEARWERSEARRGVVENKLLEGPREAPGISSGGEETLVEDGDFGEGERGVGEGSSRAPLRRRYGIGWWLKICGAFDMAYSGALAFE